MKNLKFWLFILSLYSSQSYSYQALDNVLDFSFDNVRIAENELMGLVGGNYLVRSPLGVNYGLGVYGATKGRRGGFFTGGAQAQYQKQFFSNLIFGVEGFIGGGGGGSAPQGGGLMLRGSLFTGLVYDSHTFKFAYSHVSFPNGDIESNQLSLGYAYSFKTIYYPGWPSFSSSRIESAINKLDFIIVPQNFSFQTSFYFPNQNNKGVSGRDLTKRMDIIGIRYQSSLTRKIWFDFETGGALGGGIDGFAQVFTGLSVKFPLTSRIKWATGSLLGSAGGGDVNTGGGLIIKAYTGLELELFKSWRLFSHLGYLTAPGGGFNAATFNLNIAKSYNGLGFSSNPTVFPKNRQIYNRKFRIRPGLQSYSYYLKHSRKSERVIDHPVSSVQLKLDSFLDIKTYFTGHAIGAMDGKAGGYAVGLVGMGYQILPRFNLEFLFGAAGGGGIDVGSGIVIEPSANVELPLSEQWAIEAGLGFVHALDGKLSSWVPSLGVSYRFSVPGAE